MAVNGILSRSKFDREERPDVDAVYMAACVAMTRLRRMAADGAAHAGAEALLGGDVPPQTGAAVPAAAGGAPVAGR